MDIITYDYFGSLYINMTNRCDCHCVFCIRDQDASALGGLWLEKEPTKEAVLEEILGRDLTPYAEIVFCGYGEPTCRADDMLWICDQLKASGRADLPPIRLNTNGHGSLINHRNIAPELKGRLDAVSVSLNGSNQEEYLRLTRPGSGEKAILAMEGTKVFKFAVEAIPWCISRVLEQRGLDLEDVDQFVLHQANARIIDAVARKCGIPAEKCHKNLDEYGNTSAASIPLVLSELARQGKVRSGSRCLVVGFGGGLTWGGALIEFA